MVIRLHKNARATPAVRRELQSASGSNKALARQYHLHASTVAKWRRRTDVQDASHCPHHLNTTLSPAQEAVVVELRRTTLLPLDDLLRVTREFIHPEVSRSGLDRCLRRHGVSNLADLRPQEETPSKPVKTFKDYAPGFLHVDVKYLPQMPDEDARTYLFVGIDRATRWVYLERLPDKSATNASDFLKRLLAAFPAKVVKVLTDNGKEFTDRFCATGEREPTGQHPFDQTCTAHHIEHRLIKPRHPQTNGMVERFNGRIADILTTTRFYRGEQLSSTLQHYSAAYNHLIPQRNLGHLTPLEALCQWYDKKPELFHSDPHNLPGPDS
jgi:IS30 family transposase